MEMKINNMLKPIFRTDNIITPLPTISIQKTIDKSTFKGFLTLG